nr:colicin D domain-containing protein [Pseudomonas aeruginosa]
MLSSPLDSGIFTRRQLQKKFDSHKYDFGLGEKSANNGTLAEFRDKILEHLADPATVEKGTYHSEVK